MSYPTTLREYYRRIIGAGRGGDPTMDEARADYSRAIDAQLSGWLSLALFAAR